MKTTFATFAFPIVNNTQKGNRAIENDSHTSGIKEKDAIKIDAALKAMKISGNTTVTNEVRNEARRFFEYEIDF